jgi:hypothetical protein
MFRVIKNSPKKSFSAFFAFNIGTMFPEKIAKKRLLLVDINPSVSKRIFDNHKFKKNTPC